MKYQLIITVQGFTSKEEAEGHASQPPQGLREGLTLSTQVLEQPDDGQVDDLSDSPAAKPTAPEGIIDRMKEKAEKALEEKPGLTPVDELPK